MSDEYSTELHNVTVNFYDSDDVDGFSAQAEQELAEHIIDKSGFQPNISLEGKNWASRAVLEEHLLTYEGFTPWFGKWREFYIESCRFSHHELIDQPYGFFFVLSTSDSNIKN